MKDVSFKQWRESNEANTELKVEYVIYIQLHAFYRITFLKSYLDFFIT